MATAPQKIREEFRVLALLSHPGRKQDLDDYIEEAEHQEGGDYWAEYGPVQNLLEDFSIYLREIDLT